MKNIMLLLVLGTPFVRAQGPLFPPGSPAPTQKSLQQIWDKIGGLETQLNQTQTELAELKTNNRLISGLLAASTVNIAWGIRTVDGTASVGRYSSLAFGPDGQPAISHYDLATGDLKFTRFNGTTWATTTVDSTDDVGQFTSLAFDASGQPAISYYDVTHADLKFARYNGSTWAIATAANTGSVGKYTSLAFDSTGEPLISFYDESNTSLNFATFNGFLWISTTLDNSASVGKHTSLAIGSDGQPAVSYTRESPPSLKFATRSSGSWVASTVTSINTDDAYTSLAFNPSGEPAISYKGISEFSAPSGRLEYALFHAGAWNIEYLDSTSGQANETSLAFGPDGQPAIAYDGGSGLKIARYDGTQWTYSTVDSAAGIGFDQKSLAFDPDGQPAVSYRKGSGLNFASKGIFHPAP